MKRNILLLLSLVNYVLIHAQIGVNTVTPNATMDVVAMADNSSPDGFIPPRLTLAELTRKGDTTYGTLQNGVIIYITDCNEGDTLGQRANITNTGYYYFDSLNNMWVPHLKTIYRDIQLIKDNSTLPERNTANTGETEVLSSNFNSLHGGLLIFSGYADMSHTQGNVHVGYKFYINDELQGTCTQYHVNAQAFRYTFYFSITNIPAGEHTWKLTINGNSDIKNHSHTNGNAHKASFKMVEIY